MEVDGFKLQISRRKSIALLAYLAATGQPQSRDALAALFYPENDQSSGRSNLRRDLFDLKTSLGEKYLLVERDRITLLTGADIWVDVNEFRARIEYAFSHHPPKNRNPDSLCTDCLTGLAEAVEYYTADFLSGFILPASREFEEWQFFQAEKFRQALAEALQILIQVQSLRHDYTSAIHYGRNWLALDPLNEPAHRLLMRLYAESGQQAAAVHQYQECVRRLHTELAVEPDEETTALFEAIRNRQIYIPESGGSTRMSPLQGMSYPGQVPNNLPPAEEQLIGRERELDSITLYLRDVPDCRLLTIVGPGGIGKTSLAIEASFRLAEDPACPFCEGIYFVNLAAISQEEYLITAIGEALLLTLLAEPDQRTQQLLNYLKPKRLLLLLDNIEHLISPQSTRLLLGILAHAPQVKLLITSRERLNAHLEQVISLIGLDIPKPEAKIHSQSVEVTISGYSAIQLFAFARQAVKAQFFDHPE